MPRPPVVARVRISAMTTRIEAEGGYVRVARFGDAAAAMRVAHPDRDVQYVFDDPRCIVGRHGRQVLLTHGSWVYGEEQLLVTHRHQEQFPLFSLHELIYSGGTLEESRYIDLSNEHLGELGLAVELMQRIADSY
ncbi:hypothetical protein GCM10023339_76290 [Alloalcanivorax gelatiniphagus]